MCTAAAPRSSSSSTPACSGRSCSYSDGAVAAAGEATAAATAAGTSADARKSSRAMFIRAASREARVCCESSSAEAMKAPFAVFAAADKSSGRAWGELLLALVSHMQLLLLWLLLASSAGSSVTVAQAVSLVEFQAFPLLRYDATAAAAVTAAAAAAAGGSVGGGDAVSGAAAATSPSTAATGGNTPTLFGAWGTPSFSSTALAARVAATVVTLQHCIVPATPQQQDQQQKQEVEKGKNVGFGGCRKRMQVSPVDLVLQQVTLLPKKSVVLLRFEDLSVSLLDALAAAGRSMLILLPLRSSAFPPIFTSSNRSLDSSSSPTPWTASNSFPPAAGTPSTASSSSSSGSLYGAALYAQQQLCVSAEDEQRLRVAEQHLALRFFSGACFFAYATPELETLYSELQQKQRAALAALLQPPLQQQLLSYNPSQPPLCTEPDVAAMTADPATTSSEKRGEAEVAAAARKGAAVAPAGRKGSSAAMQNLFSVFDSTKAVVVQPQPHTAAPTAQQQQQQQRTASAGETIPLAPQGTNVYAWLPGKAKENGTPPKIVALVTHHDAFAAAPLLAFGARENGTGVAALMELARTFAALYDREGGLGAGSYSLLFLFTDAGAADYSGALHWLNSVNPGVLESVAYVLCLDDLAMEPQASQVYLHTPKKYKDPVSRRLLHSLASSLDLAGFSLLLKPKKIALHSAGAPLQLLWQHEQFTLKRLLAASLSARADARPLWQRSSVLDTSPPSAEALQKLVTAVADGLAHFVYEIPDPTVDILNIRSSGDSSRESSSGSSSYAPFAPFLEAWLSQASQTSRFYAVRDAGLQRAAAASPRAAGAGDAGDPLSSAETYLHSIHRKLQQLLTAAHVQQFSLQLAGGRRFFYDPPVMLAVVESRPLVFELLLLLLAIIYTLSVYFSLVGWGRCMFLLRATIASSLDALRGTKPRRHGAVQSKKLT